jgi:hypothetical protein
MVLDEFSFAYKPLIVSRISTVIYQSMVNKLITTDDSERNMYIQTDLHAKQNVSLRDLPWSNGAGQLAKRADPGNEVPSIIS